VPVQCADADGAMGPSVAPVMHVVRRTGSPAVIVAMKVAQRILGADKGACVSG